MAENIDKIGEV